jgi:hypothetical protein
VVETVKVVMALSPRRSARPYRNKGLRSRATDRRY